MIPQALLVIFSLIFICCEGEVMDFCVGDLSQKDGPAGYACKDPSKVTTNDFVFSGLAPAGKINPLINASFGAAFSPQFPALNGLGVSMAKLDLEPSGFIPMHTHPRATELFYVMKGEISAGFIAPSSNQVYSTKVKEGQIMVLPQGALHYQFNSGKGSASAILTFSSPIPGAQVTDFALFSTDMPTDILQKTTFFDASVIKKMKGMLGGKN